MNFQDFCLVTPVDFSNPWPLLPLINMGILWSFRFFIRDEVSLREWVYISYSDHRALLSSLNVAGCGRLVYGYHGKNSHFKNAVITGKTWLEDTFFCLSYQILDDKFNTARKQITVHIFLYYSG